MASHGFPGSHTTTTTTATTTKVTTVIRFDPKYVRTIPGMLKCGQILFSLLGFICVRVAEQSRESSAGWFTFVSGVSFWVTLILLVFYLFHLIEKLHFMPWLLSEFIYCVAWALFYAIAAIVVCSKASGDDAFAAAGVFGFVCMCLYGGDGFLKYKAWRSGDIAQGERVTSTTTTSSSAPY